MKTAVKDVMTTRVDLGQEGRAVPGDGRRPAQRTGSARSPSWATTDKVIGVVSEADMLTKEAVGPGSDLRHPAPQGRGEGARDNGGRPDDGRGGGRRARRTRSSTPPSSCTTRKVKRLPVIDADGHLVGIISRADVLAVFDRTDEDIRKEITDEVLRGEFLVDPTDLRRDGQRRHRDPDRACPRPSEVGHEIVRAGPARPGRGSRPRPPQLPASERPAPFDVLANFPMD